MDSYFTVGEIVNTQGIKGELRLLPDVDDVQRFKLLDHIYLDFRGRITRYEIENVRFHKQFVLVKLKGIDDINDAEKLKGSKAKITEDMAVPCEEDEYYVRDLYDMDVYDENGKKLGIITDVIFTGANDVYTVTNEKNEEILIPAIKDCILGVDTVNKKMTVRLLEGLV